MNTLKVLTLLLVIVMIFCFTCQTIYQWGYSDALRHAQQMQHYRY